MAAGPFEQPLPLLREDLRILEAGPEADGAPAWVIQDPVINRFYRIGWFEFECLLRWGRCARDLAAEVAAATPLEAAPDQVLALAGFLARHQLVRPGPLAVDRLAQQTTRSSWQQWRWWLHHYLFFRIPLVHPQALLAGLSRWMAPVFGPAALWLLATLSACGLALVFRQWDVFSAALVESVSLQGLIGFALALVFAKTLHELGHALVATHLGVRVAHMGVAFVVLWPMLYTDTSESWKLASHRARLAVSSAGILTELGLAGIATVGWALSDPGWFNTACLYLATTSWVLSLTLNVSPFMRFDGYFILTDLLDFPNLHERSSALGRVALRRALLGLDEAWPEDFPARERRLLIAFALATWIYRALVFVGIAIAVYLLFPKAVGIFLALVEVGWFVLAPISRELKVWLGRRSEIPRRRYAAFAVLGAAAFVVAAIPWRTEVRGDAVALAARQIAVFTPYPAQIVSVRAAGAVAAGEPLVQLDAPDIRAHGARNTARAEGLSAQLTGLQAQERGLEQTSATGQLLGEQLAEMQGTAEELARLRLIADFDGLWVDVDPLKKPGVWVDTRASFGMLVDPRQWAVDAYIGQADVERVKVGASAVFYVERQLEVLRGRVILIDTTRVARIDHPMLATRHGGPIPVSAQGRDSVPAEPRFRVRIELESAPASLRETRGVVVIEGERHSLLGHWLGSALAVLIRESGF